MTGEHLAVMRAEAARIKVIEKEAAPAAVFFLTGGEEFCKST